MRFTISVSETGAVPRGRPFSGANEKAHLTGSLDAIMRRLMIDGLHATSRYCFGNCGRVADRLWCWLDDVEDEFGVLPMCDACWEAKLEADREEMRRLRAELHDRRWRLPEPVSS